MATAGKPHPATTLLPGGLQRYFEIALYLMVSAAFVTLASTGGLGIASMLLVGAALLFRGYLLFGDRAWLIRSLLRGHCFLISRSYHGRIEVFTEGHNLAIANGKDVNEI